MRTSYFTSDTFDAHGKWLCMATDVPGSCDVWCPDYFLLSAVSTLHWTQTGGCYYLLEQDLLSISENTTPVNDIESQSVKSLEVRNTPSSRSLELGKQDMPEEWARHTRKTSSHFTRL